MKRIRIISIFLIFIVLLTGIFGGCNKNNGGNSGNGTGNNPGGPVNVLEKDYPFYANSNGSTRYNAISHAPSIPEIDDEIVYKTYYFDSANGNDGNDGLSEATPKQTLTAAQNVISAVQKQVPTKVLFKAGSLYKGTGGTTFAIPNFEANDESPLILGVYGVTDTEKYVKLEGASGGNCVSINNGNLRITNFECYGPEAYQGMQINTKRAGALKNLVIQNCYIHDINFRLEDKSTLPPADSRELFDNYTIQGICPDSKFDYGKGGIIAEATTTVAQGASWFENFWIENNRIEFVSRVGVWVFGKWTHRPGCDWGVNPYYSDEIGWYPHKNVNIVGNELRYCGGDSIILGGTVGGFVEYNLSYHAQFLARSIAVCAGIWLHSCKYIVMQFNEASWTHTRRDGEGFDIDIGNSYILFQYNYTHHNDGGGLLICNREAALNRFDENGEKILDEDGIPIREKVMAEFHNIVVRNNVFADNQTADIQLSGKVDDVRMENNIFIAPEERDLKNMLASYCVIQTKVFGSFGLKSYDWSFSNNICVMRDTYELNYILDPTFLADERWEMKNNVFYNFHSKNYAELDGYEFISGVLKDNPQLSTTVALDGYENSKNFMVNNAKLFSGATKLKTANKFDYLGNDVSNVNYYGAYVNVNA